MTIKILTVDDEPDVRRLIEIKLKKAGFEVITAADGEEGVEKAKAEKPDLILMDVMMPKMDGLDVLKRLRRESNIPVLMLTARGEETDRIVGLEMGADDYLPKTFSSRELLARLRAVTRRYDISTQQPKTTQSNTVLIFGELEINKDARTVRLDDKPLNLTPIEYDLLARLPAVCRPGPHTGSTPGRCQREKLRRF